MAQEHQDPSPGAPGGAQQPSGSPQSPGAPQAPQSPGVAHGGSPSAGQLAGPLPRASFGQRLGAFAIDLGIILVAEIIIGFIFGIIITAIANTGSGVALGVAGLLGLITFLLYLAIPIVYFGYMEGQPSGQTFGKRMLNIRVVDFTNAGPLPIGRAMLRSLVRSLLSGIFLLGYLWMLWDPQQQTWHDKLIGTTVVPTSAYPV